MKTKKIRTVTNLELLASIRKPMPPAKQIMAAKKNRQKSDVVGRKAKHKGSYE